jgi:hypothetical protein
VPTAPLTLPLGQKHCRSMCGCNWNGSDAMQSTTQHEVDREEKELRPPRAIPVADYHTRTLSISEGKLCDFLLTVTFRTRSIVRHRVVRPQSAAGKRAGRSTNGDSCISRRRQSKGYNRRDDGCSALCSHAAAMACYRRATLPDQPVEIRQMNLNWPPSSPEQTPAKSRRLAQSADVTVFQN